MTRESGGRWFWLALGSTRDQTWTAPRRPAVAGLRLAGLERKGARTDEQDDERQGASSSFVWDPNER